MWEASPGVAAALSIIVADLEAEVDALRDDLDDTLAQLAEMQERLEFTELLLAAGRESQEDKSG